MDHSPIQARNIRKTYGDLVAVDDISFTVRRGECYGLLGPNGSGKSSTMRLIGCTSPLSGGDLWVNGKSVRRSPREIRRVIGVVPQEENLDEDFTVLQNLLVYARYFNVARETALVTARAHLRFFQLHEREHSKVETLSGGMKRRLLIARALVHHPRIVILDEPTTGLDPQSRHLLWDRIEDLKGQGITLVLSTHYMEEAARLCDRLVIMDRGRILAEGAPQELVQQYAGEHVLELRVPAGQQAAVRERAAAMGLEATEGEGWVFVYARNEQSQVRELSRDYQEVRYHPATLEDVYLRLTGRGLREEAE